MRRASMLGLFLLAALCWLAAGPGGRTIQALVACRHHATPQAHHSHRGPPSAPSDGPCFCDEMTGALDLAVSPAVPVPAPSPVIALPVRVPSYASLFPLPPSPAFAPATPPPDGLA